MAVDPEQRPQKAMRAAMVESVEKSVARGAAAATSTPDGHVHDLTPDQYAFLLRPLSEGRVRILETGSKAKYIESWDAIRYLDRIFGFTGWSDDTEYRLVSERFHQVTRKGKNDKEYTADVVSVVYSARVALTIKCPVCKGELTHFSDVAAGDSINQPLNNIGEAHGNAAKEAVSDALKRCARKLGDQFGLSLYEKGLRPENGWFKHAVGRPSFPRRGCPCRWRSSRTTPSPDRSSRRTRAPRRRRQRIRHQRRPQSS